MSSTEHSLGKKQQSESATHEAFNDAFDDVLDDIVRETHDLGLDASRQASSQPIVITKVCVCGCGCGCVYRGVCVCVCRVCACGAWRKQRKAAINTRKDGVQCITDSCSHMLSRLVCFLLETQL